MAAKHWSEEHAFSLSIAWITKEWSTKRREHYEAHKAYLATSPIATVISGPLLGEDGETMIGSFLSVRRRRPRRRAGVFNRDDPFNKAGIWRSVEIRPFLKRRRQSLT